MISRTSSNVDLLARRTKAVPRGVATATPVFAARADNAELWDVEGQRFIDFAGGIAVLNTGHRHPRVLEAVARQLNRYTHTAFQVVAYEPYIELAERLNRLAPFAGPAKTLLLTTGAEAVENAIKIARAATGRRAVIAFSGGFHGRTFMTLALTGKTKPYKATFGPLPSDVYRLPFPISQYGVDTARSLETLASLFATDVEPRDVAAFVIEPVQGEGGFHPAPVELLEALRRICDEHGILLVADEVQTGFARTGRMFAIEHFGVEPDLVTIAKSLAGGFPLAGVVGRAEVMDTVQPGGLGGTYAGSPVACAAALAVLDVIEQEGLNARAVRLGSLLRDRLSGWCGQPAMQPISNVRGLGAMVAFDCVTADGGPDGGAAKALTDRALENGLILLSCGVHGETIRLLMPLTAADEVVEEGLTLLERALTILPVPSVEAA